MPVRTLLAALVVCAIALAGCGSSSKPGSSGSSGTQALTYTSCMRAHGMPNFPDPGSGGALPNPALPAFRVAERACAKLQPVGLHLGGPATPSATELRTALAFAQCMRAHGLAHFPDPLTAYGPGLVLGRGEYFPNIGTEELQSPAFKRAARACGEPGLATPPPGKPISP